MSAAFMSCASDDSTVATELIPDIEIAELSESAFTVVSYEGNRLQLSPTVTTTYPESELTYNWFLIDRAKETAYHSESDTDYHFDRELIATGRSLDYEVSLTPGEYLLVFEVSASNGYTVSRTATLNAVTNFTQGLYILKETADGKTELDLLNTADSTLMENVLTATHGQPFAARPQNLSTARGHCYIDTETNETASSNMVTVTTQDGGIYVMRNSDLRVVLSRDDLLFTQMADDEQPYRIVSGMWGNYLLTSRGVRYQYTASMSLSTSGKYGLESEIAASPFACYEESSSSIFFWDAQSHSIATCDFNGTTTLCEDDRYKVTGLSRMNCAAVGYNAAAGYVVFVLESLDGSQRQLALITSSFGGGTAVETLRALRVNTVNSARLFAVCYSSAALLYGVVGNQIYGLDLNSFTEQEITPAGLSDDEQIVYLSNQTSGADGLFDYLVVGTQQSDRYTLRFYRLLGGLPDGAPVITLHGTGTPRAIHYTDNSALHFGNAPLND